VKPAGWALGALLMASGCSRPAPPAVSGPLAAAESAFFRARNLADTIMVGRARGLDTVPGTPRIRALLGWKNSTERLVARLDTLPMGAEDRRVVRVLRANLAVVTNVKTPGDVIAAVSGAEDLDMEHGFCRYAPARVLADSDGVTALSDRIMACYTEAAASIPYQGRRLDRLTVLSKLATTDARSERRRLFLALQPVWRSVNGAGDSLSPWRQLTRERVRRFRSRSDQPEAIRAMTLGLPLDSVETWLVRILETWRATQPDTTLEPWDYHRFVGEASRRLSPRIPREQLEPLTRQWYRSLGADLDSLRIHSDLAPRPRKTAVAFTSFGGRPHRMASGWFPGEPWIFATYKVGGLDNLLELVHENGHAIHIAGIRTRPAYADWPDSDVFTEALGDIVSLDLYDPSWQIRMLGDSVPLAVGLRGKYGGVVLDVTWALLEIRMFKDPAADPNRVWADLTSQYLHIRPHPELSWWAMRGQLIESPGYMLNYGLGAVLTAQLRARIRVLRGDWVAGDPGWYPWVRDRIYRFGLERPTSVVLQDFLGAALSPDAILADLRAER
jgi:hypothetical protein